jgi:hypothetical protein
MIEQKNSVWHYQPAIINITSVSALPPRLNAAITVFQAGLA